MHNETDCTGHQLPADVCVFQESVPQSVDRVCGRQGCMVCFNGNPMEVLEQKTNAWFAEVIVNAIVNNENTIRVSPSFFFNLIQADPDDNKFVDCAVCGNAEFIVSNDSHFRILDDIDWPKLQLVTIQEYIKEIGK